MTRRRRATVGASLLGRRPWRFLCALLAISLSASCGLSPGIEIPSAADGTDSMDGSPGSGGLSGSGGGPSCAAAPLHTECRGMELWQVSIPSGCVQSLLSQCSGGCITDAAGVAACADGGGGEGGGGGAAGAASTDDSEP